MKLKKSIVLLLISIFSLYFFQLEVYASSSFGDIESQITPGSSDVKIKKLQTLFKELGLYNGNIDGNYKSIEKSLIDYQIKAGIVNNSSDWGAGYFGKKTIVALRNDYADRFEKLSEKHIKMEKPDLSERTFITTAYYSPILGQSRYSYNVRTKRYRNYREEIKLQGDGKTTASGKGVFEGLLAAPKNYTFGTKIEFEGIGIGVVEDRGGAIVNAGERSHEYDRIDIWMGYGLEGLQRAEKWGKREVKGKIIADDIEITIGFEESLVTKYNNLRVDAKNPKDSNVISLQSLFSELGLYDGEIDGNYSNIKNTLIDFQVKNKIVASKNSTYAGYFGEKTLAVLRKKYIGEIFKEVDKNYYLTLKKKQKIENIKDLLNKFINKKSNGDLEKQEKYKISIKKNIDKYIAKTKTTSKKQELLYLKNIL